MDPNIIEEKFKALYGTPAFMARSPGRVNLIGEHTDYNQGFVLPAAIDKEIVLAIAENGTQDCRFHAVDFGESVTVPLATGPYPPTGNPWADYVVGVMDQLRKNGHRLGGFDLVFGGDIPLGAGMSSSAALECGVAFALNHLFGLGEDKLALVKHAQMAENEFVGVKCGIMDQFANMFGQAGHVVRLDCRSLDYAYFPFDTSGYSLLLFDTQVKHSLASSAYNERRAACEEGVRRIRQHHPEVESLRDCTPAMVEEVLKGTEGRVYDRCRYIVAEIGRVVEACDALQNGEMGRFGAFMYATHEGLRHQYEVSCEELDVLVDIAQAMGPVLGARMMGGGFGGCTINLARAVDAEGIAESVSAAYQRQLGKDIKVYHAAIKGGTGLL